MRSFVILKIKPELAEDLTARISIVIIPKWKRVNMISELKEEIKLLEEKFRNLRGYL